MKAHHGKNMRVSADVDVRAASQGCLVRRSIWMIDQMGCVSKDNLAVP